MLASLDDHCILLESVLHLPKPSTIILSLKLRSWIYKGPVHITRRSGSKLNSGKPHEIGAITFNLVITGEMHQFMI